VRLISPSRIPALRAKVSAGKINFDLDRVAAAISASFCSTLNVFPAAR
jgi:hypothetical protein